MLATYATMGSTVTTSHCASCLSTDEKCRRSSASPDSDENRRSARGAPVAAPRSRRPAQPVELLEMAVRVRERERDTARRSARRISTARDRDRARDTACASRAHGRRPATDAGAAVPPTRSDADGMCDRAASTSRARDPCRHLPRCAGSSARVQTVPAADVEHAFVAAQLREIERPTRTFGSGAAGSDRAPDGTRGSRPRRIELR